MPRSRSGRSDMSIQAFLVILLVAFLCMAYDLILPDMLRKYRDRSGKK